MRYYLDTEFNGFGGELISLAMVCDRKELYLATVCQQPTPWVKENVMPVIDAPGAAPMAIHRHHFGKFINEFLKGDSNPIVMADWPDDIAYLCRELVIGPGAMIPIPRVTFELHRVDAYPTKLPGAIQHNALWDARALMAKLI